MTNIPKCSPVKENEIKHEQNADDCESKGHGNRQIKQICLTKGLTKFTQLTLGNPMFFSKALSNQVLGILSIKNQKIIKTTLISKKDMLRLFQCRQKRRCYSK